jgi:hypothetical protein
MCHATPNESFAPLLKVIPVRSESLGGDARHEDRLRFVALSAIVGVGGLTASAQQPAATPDPADAAKAACTDLYTKWRENYKGGPDQQKTAYDAGKDFLVKCPNDDMSLTWPSGYRV